MIVPATGCSIFNSHRKMTHDLFILSITAAAIGFVHTILGPDHYVPFIMMAHAGKWSRFKMMMITLICGIGHVLSSVVIGLIGIALGVALHKLISIESVRGDIAAWILTAFGILYFFWGWRQAYLNKPHTHFHQHPDGTEHLHNHVHRSGHAHAHEDKTKSIMTTWALFTIFVLGPCEPLIPILMYPAARQSIFGLIWITAVFGIVTISTMMIVVTLISTGLAKMPMKTLERYTHALAGGIIALTGVAIQIFQL